MKPILVTCYVSPDLDGVAGAVAYGEFLQKTGVQAVVGIIGEPHNEAKYLLDRFHIPYPQKLPNANYFDQIVLVDASDLNGLEGKISPEKIIEIIDHRKIHEAKKFPNAKVQIELVGAAATLVAEKFMQQNLAISVESAILLYGAIISNTLNFKGSVTTERDGAAATWLNRVAELPESFWKELFTAKSDLSGSKLAESMRSDSAWFDLGGKKIGIVQIEIIGAKKLVEERTAEIVDELEKIKKMFHLDLIFQNTIELEEAKNFFVTNDEEMQKLLEDILDVHFSNNIAERSSLLMRKQIVPLLKERLEKHETKNTV